YAFSLDVQAASAPALALAQVLGPGPGPLPVGSEMTLALTATNTGGAAADGVVVRACLDPALDTAGLTLLDGGALDAAPAPAGCGGHWVSWSLPAPLASAASGT